MSPMHLPNELHHLIASHLPIDSLFRLRLTNTHFHTLLPPPTLSASLHLEASPSLHGLFLYCACCNLLLPLPSFASITAYTRPAGSADAHFRFCLRCGFSETSHPECTAVVPQFADREKRCWHAYTVNDGPVWRDGKVVMLCQKCAEIRPRYFGRYAQEVCKACREQEMGM